MYAPLRLARELGRDAAPRCGSPPPPAPRCSPSTTPATRSAAASSSPPTTTPPTAPAARYAYNVAGAGFDATSCVVVDRTPATPDGRCADRPAAPARRAHRARPRCVAATPSHQRIDTAARAAARPRLLLLRRPTRSAGCSRTSPTSRWRRRPRSARRRSRAAARTTPSRCPSSTSRAPSTRRCSSAALDGSAARIAQAVGASPSWCSPSAAPTPVLVSLARAGTPVGVLMRRWAQHAHGLDLPHYAVSHRPRPRHRRRRAALAGRPPRPGRRRLRRRLDRQGRHHPRTGRRALARHRRLRPGDRGARRPRPAACAPTAPARTSSSPPPASTRPSPG